MYSVCTLMDIYTLCINIIDYATAQLPVLPQCLVLALTSNIMRLSRVGVFWSMRGLWKIALEKVLFVLYVAISYYTRCHCRFPKQLWFKYVFLHMWGMASCLIFHVFEMPPNLHKRLSTKCNTIIPSNTVLSSLVFLWCVSERYDTFSDIINLHPNIDKYIKVRTTYYYTKH